MSPNDPTATRRSPLDGQLFESAAPESFPGMWTDPFGHVGIPGNNEVMVEVHAAGTCHTCVILSWTPTKSSTGEHKEIIRNTLKFRYMFGMKEYTTRSDTKTLE